MPNIIKRSWMAMLIGSRAALAAFNATRQPPSSPGSFEPLTPLLLEDKGFKRYEKELLKGLQNRDVLNIAVTGVYGAGKSSVLKTFFERHPEFPRALVSLATFSKTQSPPGKAVVSSEADGGDPTANVATPPDLLNRIEETVVQQLLYSVPASKLPKTRLKRITQAPRLAIYTQAMLLICLLVSILRFCLPAIESSTNVEVKLLIDSLNAIPEWLAVAWFLVGGGYLLYTALRFISLFSIDGLALKGGKLETTNHGSVLHKNVDEIIYCFERSDIRVVVIEDLDRFDIQDIYFRLREINFIVNQSPQVRRPVHFIYAIRDDLFTVTDKTKFFDLIIPIIPVVNSENSREKLNELMMSRMLGESILGAELDATLVETVCYYIDEMRLVKNIVNEFDIYSDLLANDGLNLNPNKLFAIVVLRNLHPQAYADLIKRQGAIYSVFAGFKSWVRLEAAKLQDEIRKLRVSLTEKEEEVAKSITELRACFWMEVIKQAGLENANMIKCDQGVTFTLPDLVTDDSFARVSQSVRVQPVFQDQYGRSTQQGKRINVENVLREMNYDARAARVEQSIDAVEHEISQLLELASSIKSLAFREAVKDRYGEMVSGTLQGLEVVIYLMRKGLLDTDYVDYLGYFYEGSITQADKNFILALTRGEVLDVTTTLDDPERVLNKLEVDTLDAGRGLIANVIENLAQQRNNQAIEQAKLKLAMVLRSAHSSSDRFAEAMELIIVGGGGGKACTVQALLEVDQDLILQLLEAKPFQPAPVRSGLICAILDTLTNEQVAGLKDPQGLLLDAVSGLPDVTEILPKLEKPYNGWKWLRDKTVKFDNLSEATGAATLRKLVELGCLKLSLPMLRLLTARLADKNLLSDPVTYRGLLSLGLTGLADQIEQMSNAFVDELLSQQKMLDESESSLTTLLRYIRDDQEQMEALLESTNCNISDLTLIPRTLWVHLLKGDRIEPARAAAWAFLESSHLDENVVATEENEDDAEALANIHEAFLQYVNRHADVLGRTLWQGDEDDQRALQSFFLENESISNKTLKSLLHGVNLSAEVVLRSDLPAARWEYVVYNSTVPYTPEIHATIVSTAGNLEGVYIQRRWTIARDTLNLHELTVPVVLEVSRNNAASLEDVLCMWTAVPFEAYIDFRDAIAELARVCRHANDQGACFTASYLPVLIQIAQLAELEREERVDILVQALSLEAGWAQMAPVLDLIDSTYLKLATSGMVSLPSAPTDRRLLEALRVRGFVGSVKLKGQRIVAYGKPSAIQATIGG